MKLLKAFLEFFKNLFSKTKTAHTYEANPKKNPFKRSSAPRELSNSEKRFNFLEKHGYTSRVHLRGKYAIKETKPTFFSTYRAIVISEIRKRTKLKENGIEISLSEKKNRYGFRTVLNA